MIVSFKDLETLSIEANSSDLENQLCASDFNYLVSFYFETCANAFIEGCVQYMKRDDVGEYVKSEMMKSMLKNSYLTKENISEFFSDILLDKLK